MAQGFDSNSVIKLVDPSADIKTAVEARCVQDAYRSLHIDPKAPMDDIRVQSQFGYTKDQCIQKALADDIWNKQVAPALEDAVNRGQQSIKFDYSKVKVDNIGQNITNELVRRNYVNESRSWTRDILVNF